MKGEIKLETKELITLVKSGEPIAMSDQELIDVAVAAVNELRQRMPRYAFDQGDLSWDDPRAVAMMVSAEDAWYAIDELQGAWR